MVSYHLVLGCHIWMEVSSKYRLSGSVKCIPLYITTRPEQNYLKCLVGEYNILCIEDISLRFRMGLQYVLCINLLIPIQSVSHLQCQASPRIFPQHMNWITLMLCFKQNTVSPKNMFHMSVGEEKH